MAVWNILDTKLISDIIGEVNPDGEDIKPKKQPNMSVANYVRVQASISHKKERRHKKNTNMETP